MRLADDRTLSRRQWCGRALALAGAAALGGCVVTPYGTYYRPSTAQPGAVERRGWCQGKAGPVTALDIDLGRGLRMEARTDRAEPSGHRLRLLLTVPADTALRLAGPARLLTADGQAIALAWSASARRAVPVQAGQWFDPRQLRPGSGAAAARDREAPFGSLFLQAQPVPGPLPRAIVIEGLSLAAGARMLVLPAQTLARPAGPRQARLYRSAEEQAAVQARAAACQRETPRLACGNILEFSEGSHSGTLPGTRWNGQWAALDIGGEALRGEMSFALQEPGPWRVDGSGWQLRDAAGGAARPLRVATATLRFDDAIDPQAGLPAGTAETRLSFEASLPPDIGSFELRLPLLRDGTPVDLAPIRFERRSLDGGAEPFNC